MESNKTIVISGCTKGIGRAIAETFAAVGFNIAGYARNSTEISAMQHSLAEQYPKQQFLIEKADASQKHEVIAFAHKVKSRFNKIDVLVNNAGFFLPGSIMSETDGTLESLIDTNLYSAYHLTRAFNKHINQHIFNICSIASLQAYEAGASYTISKFALLGFSKQLRHELKPTGIKVTAIMPGAVLTGSWDGTNLPPKRFIRAEDVAKTIFSAYSLSDGADIEEIVIRPQLGDI